MLNQYVTLSNRRIQEKTLADECRSFRLHDRLVGAYLLGEDYIQDIVVAPAFQNCGYGTYMLAQCIRHLYNKGHNRAGLRVAKSNTGALRWYERNGFQIIASFAEHTYTRSNR